MRLQLGDNVRKFYGKHPRRTTQKTLMTCWLYKSLDSGHKNYNVTKGTVWESSLEDLKYLRLGIARIIIKGWRVLIYCYPYLLCLDAF